MDCTLTVRLWNGGDAVTVPTAPENMGTARAFSIELNSSLLKSSGVQTEGWKWAKSEIPKKRNRGCEATTSAEDERCGDGDGMEFIQRAAATPSSVCCRSRDCTAMLMPWGSQKRHGTLAQQCYNGDFFLMISAVVTTKFFCLRLVAMPVTSRGVLSRSIEWRPSHTRGGFG
jgi:hypothetical protein